MQIKSQSPEIRPIIFLNILKRERPGPLTNSTTGGAGQVRASDLQTFGIRSPNDACAIFRVAPVECPINRAQRPLCPTSKYIDTRSSNSRDGRSPKRQLQVNRSFHLAVCNWVAGSRQRHQIGTLLAALTQPCMISEFQFSHTAKTCVISSKRMNGAGT